MPTLRDLTWADPATLAVPQGYPASEFCDWCDEWHPPGLHACSCESDGRCVVHDEEEV